MTVTLYSLAARFLGVHEIAGHADHPLIQWWLSRVDLPIATHDEIAWCSAFVAGIAWQLDLPRSESASARSWLHIGSPVASLDVAQPKAFDVVILTRGNPPQPPASVLNAQGHVGILADVDRTGARVQLLGGNQGDAVSVQWFNADRILGIRRLWSA